MRFKESSRPSHSSARKGGRRNKRQGGNEATSQSALNLVVGAPGERGARGAGGGGPRLQTSPEQERVGRGEEERQTSGDWTIC